MVLRQCRGTKQVLGAMAILVAVWGAACGSETFSSDLANDATITPFVEPSPSPTILSSQVATATPPAIEALVDIDLNVRAGPGTTFVRLALLQPGTLITILETSADEVWHRVRSPEIPNGEGWVSAEYITPLGSIPSLVITPTVLAQNKPVDRLMPISIDLALIPEIIYAGDCARLKYDIVGLTRVRLNEDPIPASQQQGSTIVCPNQNQIYRITGLNSQGDVVEQTIFLKVEAVPPIPLTGSIPVSTTAGCLFALEVLGTDRGIVCRFAPNGQQIAAPAADGSLWVVQTAGDTYQQVFDPAGRFMIQGDVVWSPDGTYIAFSTIGLDGFGQGVGYYNFTNGSMRYLGPDAQSGQIATAKYPRWTDEGQLLLTWFPNDTITEGVVSIFGPFEAAPDGPVPLPLGQELNLSAGYVSQQVYPWLPGREWHVGEVPSPEID